jgi:hypothetical protein
MTDARASGSGEAGFDELTSGRRTFTAVYARP